MYRPQWAYKTPDGYRDEPWAQCLSASAVPALGTIGGNAITPVFMVNFDRDADVWILGIAIDAGSNFRSIGVQFTDAYGYLLSDDFVGVDLYAKPLGQNPDRGGGWVRTFNPPHLVPAGGTWQLAIKNFDNTTGSIPDMELRGFKRFRVICE